MLLAHVMLPLLLVSPPTRSTLTVLTPTRVAEIERHDLDGERTWVDPEAIAELFGYEVKPEGLCTADVCIPVPPDMVIERDGLVDLGAIATLLGQAHVVNDRGDVVSLSSPPPHDGSTELGSQHPMAPAFTLPDRSGATVSLDDFRGRKVLLLTWASW